MLVFIILERVIWKFVWIWFNIKWLWYGIFVIYVMEVGSFILLVIVLIIMKIKLKFKIEFEFCF